jgi:dienelactone hydrolase
MKAGMVLGWMLCVLAARPAPAAPPAQLPGTAALDWQDDLADRMMDGLHRYIERKIAASPQDRAARWHRDPSSAKAYEASIAENRDRFRKIIGATDPRVTGPLERIAAGSDSLVVAETDRYRVYQVRWPVLDGVDGEGLLLEPRGPAAGSVVALGDADWSPEQLVGLRSGVPPSQQFARRLAENGFRVFVPVLVDRGIEYSGNPRVGYTNQTHREWIYRQAYHMGRHVIGFEVQKISALVDWLRSQSPSDKQKIGVAGYGEGGLLALYAAAADPRIDACLVSGYLQRRDRPWEEPLYRNIWSLLTEFGDAEIATLIAPRGLVVEYSAVPEVLGPPAVPKGRRGGAAVGQLLTPDWSQVEGEFARIGKLLPEGFQPRHLVAGLGDRTTGPGSDEAVTKFATLLGVEVLAPLASAAPADGRAHFDPAARQRRQVGQLEDYVQKLVRGSDAVRADFFLGKEEFQTDSAEKFARHTRDYQKYLWDEVLGRLHDQPLKPNVRSRLVYQRPRWNGYDVVLDVFPDVFAWGVLLLPVDLKPGERRPVVVCQHGRNGLPRDTIEGDHKAYHDFAAHLADRGFVVFAPHNPYRGEDRYRLLSRKANSVKASLFSFILAQHEQILDYLAALPGADPQRIAFYGLSYGGETAVRVPPLLDRYCLSICSADFNDWARKVASTDARYSFMFTIEWEMPYFNMGSTFNYAEMAALMVPRPFMVERGHADGVAPDEWVAYEYAKVRRLYDQLHLGQRTAIEFFDGPHTIHGVGTFKFLERQLRWPLP